MKNKLSFELNNLEVKEINLKIESLKVTIEVECSEEAANKMLGTYAEFVKSLIEINK